MTNNIITGGAGFFGEVICKKLLQQNKKVTIYDLNPPELKHKNLTFIEGDIRDIDKLFSIIPEKSNIYHAVAQVPLAKNKHLFHSVNHKGTNNLLEVSLKKKIQHFLYISSSAIYGIPKYNPVLENTLPTPMEEYGKAKYLAEKLCNEYAKEKLSISIIRPRTILGHGRLGIFQILFEWIYNGSNIPVMGNGDNVYQFVHADDLADACITSTQKKINGTFNIGAEKFNSMRDTLEHLIKYANSKSKIRPIPKELTKVAMNITSFLGLSPLASYHSLMYGESMYFDISKSKKLLNYNPKFSQKKMFEESYNWYLKNRENIIKLKSKSSTHKSSVKHGILKLLPYLL